MQTYTFRVLIEPDEDRWLAYCPALDCYAAETWGYTRDEARKNIHEVVRMVLEGLLEEGTPIPRESEDLYSVSLEQVAVSV